MHNDLIDRTKRLLELLGHDEAPFGVCYSDEKPEGYGPKPGEIFSREREEKGQIDWGKAFGNFTCICGSLWLARQKRKAAWISHEECGCMGGGYYAGMYAPYLETNIFYVSTGIPGTPMEGEHYMSSPDAMRTFIADSQPPPHSGRYCVIKPLERFAAPEEPLVVVFFARPETLTGLVSLAVYAAGDHNAVASPFGAGCTNIIAWPLAYAARGRECAVLGGFDPSARKFMKPDELTFAIPPGLYRKMLDRMEESALTRRTWQGVLKKARRSQRVWQAAASPTDGR